MKKAPLLITAICLLLLIIGYFGYTALQSQRPREAWDLVSKDAIFVYEGEFNHLSAKDGDSTLNLFLSHFSKDSISKGLIEILGKGSLISFHLTQRDGFDFIAYFPLSKGQRDDFAKFLNTRKGIKSKSRLFEGLEIIELAFTKSRITSIVFIDDILVMSNTSFLVEDVIRKSESETEGFKESNRQLYSFARIESDNGNLYIDLKRLSDFQNLFFSKKSTSTIAHDLGNAMLIDLKVKGNSILMNGFALDSIPSRPSVLSLFNKQRPVSFDLKSILPSRAGFVAHYGISDFNEWTKARAKFCEFHRKTVLDSLQRLEKRYTITQQKLSKSIGDEVAQFTLGDVDNNLFAIEIADKNLLMAILESINSGLSDENNYNESYSGYQIRKNQLPQFVHTLFWPLTEQTNFNFYVICENFLVFSSELGELKSFLDDVTSETTWTKSTDWNKFLESTAQETNVSFFLSNTFFPSLKNDLTNSWSSYGDSVNFFNLNKGAIQLSRLDENYYFNGTLSFFQSKKTSASSAKISGRALSFERPIESRLYQVKNHLNGAPEILIQDSENNLFLVSSDLKVLWKKDIRDKIKGAVTQVDILKNRKLQYFFVTDGYLHIIDRLGNYVKGFPKKANTGIVEFSSVVDYDNSKNYRFIIGNSLGKIFMYNKEGVALPGWRPNNRSKKLIMSLQHFKVNGKDYLISIDVDGSIYSFSRKGEIRNNFPVEIGLTSYNGKLMKIGADDELLYSLSSSGKLIQFDITGKVTEAIDLVKSSVDSKFSMATDIAKNSSVISRVDKEKIAVLSVDGTTLFEVGNPGSEKISLTYFDLSPTLKVYCFWDRQQEFAYFFDQQGKLISERPVESSTSPTVIQTSDDKIVAYSIYKNKLIQTIF